MGINLKSLIKKEYIEFKDLTGKKLGMDAYNQLYMYLSAIRQPDGKPLMDSKGRITSHLTGLFYRTMNLLQYKMKPCYVFDGKPVGLKEETLIGRTNVRQQAEKKYKEAIKKGDLAEARKYAQQMSILTQDMVKESKELLDAMGLPWVQAPHDGEAQAAWMAKKGEVYAVVSQDWDCLLYNAPVLIRNLAVSGGTRIKLIPEKIVLKDVLKSLKINQKGLVELAVLIGTDFNIGVKSIGPKIALKIIQEKRFDEYCSKIEDYNEIINIFMKPQVTKDYKLEWKPIDVKAVKKLLVDKHEFSEQRIDNAIKKLGDQKQKGLGSFF